MEIYTENLLINTSKKIEFINITPRLEGLIDKYSIEQGLLIVRSQHTTAGLLVNEDEKGLVKDMEEALRRIMPDGEYNHDDFSSRKEIEPNERKNGNAHLRASLLKVSEMVTIFNGCLQLGKWQSVMYVDLDGPQERIVLVQLHKYS